MKIDTETLTPEQEIALWRENSRRLAGALRLLAGTIDERNGDSHLHALIAPISAQVTIGDVVAGALELHEQQTKEIGI